MSLHRIGLNSPPLLIRKIAPFSLIVYTLERHLTRIVKSNFRIHYTILLDKIKAARAFAGMQKDGQIAPVFKILRFKIY
jgi:hypothetical protein